MCVRERPVSLPWRLALATTTCSSVLVALACAEKDLLVFEVRYIAASPQTTRVAYISLSLTVFICCCGTKAKQVAVFFLTDVAVLGPRVPLSSFPPQIHMPRARDFSSLH